MIKKCSILCLFLLNFVVYWNETGWVLETGFKVHASFGAEMEGGPGNNDWGCEGSVSGGMECDEIVITPTNPCNLPGADLCECFGIGCNPCLEPDADLCECYGTGCDDNGSEPDPCEDPDMDRCYCLGDCGEEETPQSVAPMATKIFRNLNMTPANWKKLEKMIEKIMKDCLGAALYNGLNTALGSGTLYIQFGNGSSFNYTNGTVTLDMMAAESNRLFHEMWHAYQAYQETQSSFAGSLLNQEMEAWYAQYLYVSQLPEYKEGSKWHGWYNDTKLGSAVQELNRYIDNKGYLLQGEFPLYNYLNNTVRTTFNQSGYPASDYPYDYDRDASYNFRNIENLSENC